MVDLQQFVRPHCTTVHVTSGCVCVCVVIRSKVTKKTDKYLHLQPRHATTEKVIHLYQHSVRERKKLFGLPCTTSTVSALLAELLISTQPSFQPQQLKQICVWIHQDLQWICRLPVLQVNTRYSSVWNECLTFLNLTQTRRLSSLAARSGREARYSHKQGRIYRRTMGLLKHLTSDHMTRVTLTCMFGAIYPGKTADPTFGS